MQLRVVQRALNNKLKKFAVLSKSANHVFPRHGLLHKCGELCRPPNFIPKDGSASGGSESNERASLQARAGERPDGSRENSLFLRESSPRLNRDAMSCFADEGKK